MIVTLLIIILPKGWLLACSRSGCYCSPEGWASPVIRRSSCSLNRSFRGVDVRDVNHILLRRLEWLMMSLYYSLRRDRLFSGSGTSGTPLRTKPCLWINGGKGLLASPCQAVPLADDTCTLARGNLPLAGVQLVTLPTVRADSSKTCPVGH